MAGTLRVLIHGLVGLDFERFNPRTGTALTLDVLCLTPELVQHRPVLSVPTTHVDAAQTTLPGTSVGSDTRFDVAGFNLSLAGLSGDGLDVKEETGTDPFNAAFELQGISNIPAAVELTGFSEVDGKFVWPASDAAITAAMLLRDGHVRSRKLKIKEFPEWRFEDGKWRLNRPAADDVVCDIPFAQLPTIVAKPRSSGDTKFVVLKPDTAITIELRHECEGHEDCKKAKGKQFPLLYGLLEHTLRKPIAKAVGLTDGSYCPPLRFWR